jgi:hypothetical protein
MSDSLVKSVTIPLMITVMVKEADEDNDVVERSARQLLMDIAEENWYDQFSYSNQVLELVDLDWLDGTYVSELGSEEADEVQEATEDGTSETGGGLRSPVGDVQAARERDEGLPL